MNKEAFKILEQSRINKRQNDLICRIVHNEELTPTIRIRLLKLIPNVKTQQQYERFDRMFDGLIKSIKRLHLEEIGGWYCSSGESNVGISFGCEQGSCFYCTCPCENGITNQSYIDPSDEECLENIQITTVWQDMPKEEVRRNRRYFKRRSA